MPRPKTELTGSNTTIYVRLTEKQKEMFKDIGGADWLRNYLQRQIRSEEIGLGLPTLKDKYDSNTLQHR
jgi:hypothetical protein